MPALTRYLATDISVFTLSGTNFLAALHNINIKTNAKTEDGSGISDDWHYTIPTKYDMEIDGDLFVDGTTLAWNIGDSYTLVLSMGNGDVYSGTFVVTNVTHSAQKEGLQMQKVTFKNQGQPTSA